MGGEKRKHWFSPVLLIPLSWMFLSVSRGVQFWEPPRELLLIDELTAGSPLERSVMMLLILLSLAVLFRRRRELRSLLRDNPALVVSFSFMALSVLWSEFPMVSIRRFFKVLGTLISVLTVLTEDDPYDRLDALLLVFFLLTIPLSALFIHAFPELGHDLVSSGESAWIGFTHSKNNLGQLAAAGGLYFCWKLLEHGRNRGTLLHFACLLLCLHLLKGSQSATSWGMMLIGIVILLFLRGTRASARRLSMTLLFSLPILVITVFLWSDLGLRRSLVEFGVARMGRDMTFTGRTTLWGDVVGFIMKKPVLGYGYGGFWIGDLGNYFWWKYSWHPEQAHNGYLDILASLGITGLIIFMGFLFITLKKTAISVRDNHPFPSLGLAFLIAICFTNLFESSFFRLNHLLWFLFLLFGTVPACRNTAAPGADRKLLEVIGS